MTIRQWENWNGGIVEQDTIISAVVEKNTIENNGKQLENDNSTIC